MKGGGSDRNELPHNFRKSEERAEMKYSQVRHVFPCPTPISMLFIKHLKLKKELAMALVSAGRVSAPRALPAGKPVWACHSTRPHSHSLQTEAPHQRLWMETATFQGQFKLDCNFVSCTTPPQHFSCIYPTFIGYQALHKYWDFKRRHFP